MPVAALAGAWVEDKGATLSIHYREAPDPDAAKAALERDAVPAVRAAGLVARFGRMTLEVLPPIPIDKGSAVRRLLLHRRIAASLYAGDDTTDIDAFAVVDVSVAVRSPEMPPGLVEAATFAVDGTEGVAGLLRELVALGAARQRRPRCCLSARVWRRATSSTVPSARRTPERPGATVSSATTRRRFTRYERWMRKKIVAGSASSSSRIDFVDSRRSPSAWIQQ